MLDFDELEAKLPPEALVVHGAGSVEVNGLYQDTEVQAFGAPIFRHAVMGDHLLSRERCGERHGWLLGANRRPLYGARTEATACPRGGWRALGGEPPAPAVESFPTLVEACQRLAEILCEEAEDHANQGNFRLASDVYQRTLAVPILQPARRAELHACRARTFRQLAESKKKAPETEDPLHGLAAEWAIDEAEKALELDEKCFLAGWEGAIAAKHIGWWNKGRHLAKKAMGAVPLGPQHRARRETASTLFLLMAEEEQEEKARKVREMQQARQKPEVQVDPKEVEWTHAVAAQLNEALKSEDFKRPHHQLWKLIGPGLLQKDSDEIFGEIRTLIWEKWNSVAWQNGYRTSWDVDARKKLLSRIVNAANTGKAEEVKNLIKEIEDRTCIEWSEISEAMGRTRHDETWAWTRREDGSWGAWGAGGGGTAH